MEEANKDKSKSQERDICFIITPIGEEGSVVRKKTDGLIDNVLEPVCNELGMKAIPAHNIDKIGSITNQVVQHVLESKMVIANLTGLNPNVMYELAIRHATKKPVVCIAEYGTKLPFDITTERTIFYSDDMYGAIRLRSELKEKLNAALSDSDIDNPIYRAKTESMIIKDIQSLTPKGNSDSLLYILQRLDNIENMIRRTGNIKFKRKNLFYDVYENDASQFQIYSIVLSKPCTNEIRSELMNYLDAHDGHNEIVNYKFLDKEILLDTNSDNLTPYINQISSILKNYDIEVLSITKRDCEIRKL